MANYRYKKSKKAYKSRKTTKAKKSNKKVATRAYVKRIMHKEVENKFYTTFASQQLVKVQVNSAPALGEGLISLVQPIALGNSSSNRIGNKVRVIKSRLNMLFTMVPYNATTNNYVPGIWVKIWIFRFKNANDRVPTTGEWQSFFKGNGTNIPFQGSQLDLTFAPEQDIFDIKMSKTLWLSSTSNSANSVPNATSYAFSSGKNCVSCSFDVTKHLGTMVYNDTTTSNIQGKNLYCVIQPIYSQQNITLGNVYVPVTLTYSQNTFYEDA